MQKYVFSCLFICVAGCLHAEAKGLNFSASLGTNSFLFNKGIIDPNMSFIAYGVNPLKNLIAGAKAEKNLTEKKAISCGLFYSNTSLQYLYNDRMGWRIAPNGIINHKGYINYSHIMFNSIGKYRVIKWINLAYGLSQSFNLKNKFDNKEIGSMIAWTDSVGKSNTKMYTIAYSLGIEFILHKHLRFEILHNRSFNNFVVLENTLYGKPFPQYPQKLVYTHFTFNYTF